MSISPALILRVDQAHGSRPSINPLLGLSPLELEALLDGSLNEPNKQTPITTGTHRNRVYYPLFANVTHTEISTEKLLQYPQIFVDKTESGFSVTYNPELRERLNQKISELKRGKEDDKNLDNVVNNLLIDRKWIEETQVAIVQYACQLEADYINSGNPFDLKPLAQNEIGKQFGYHPSSISRLVKNLAIRLPNGKVVFASELIPSKHQNSSKVRYVLEQLAKNTEYFREGVWQITDNQIGKILEKDYGLILTRRMVNRYTLELQKKI